jgi:thiol-disulfide isomerase/thioredoxin
MMRKAIYLMVALIILAAGANTAYDSVKSLNIARCLGCIAMEPKAVKFVEFWVEYPEHYNNKGIPPHPDWVINASKQKVVMLFFWGPSCEPCEWQWEAMKKAGLVKGSEENGSATANFSYIQLFSINAPYDDEKGEAIRIYTPKGDTGTPTTVILFEKNGTIYWYAFSGPANGEGGRPDINGLINILEKAKEEKYDMQS